MPSVQDPNLWLVPCLPGKERYAVEEILKKYFKYYHHQTKKLFIKTAFTTDMNTGYIYVEAFKEIHVRRVEWSFCLSIEWCKDVAPWFIACGL